jgi:hypothetical protein
MTGRSKVECTLKFKFGFENCRISHIMIILETTENLRYKNTCKFIPDCLQMYVWWGEGLRRLEHEHKKKIPNVENRMPTV